MVVAAVANLKRTSKVRARVENRTAFHAVATLLAVAAARKLLRARETEIAEIADCGHRRRRRRRREREEKRSNTGLRKGLRNGPARSRRRKQRLRAKTSRLEASWSRLRDRARRRACVRIERARTRRNQRSEKSGLVGRMKRGMVAVEGKSPLSPSDSMVKSSKKRDFARGERKERGSSKSSFRRTGSLEATRK